MYKKDRSVLFFLVMSKGQDTKVKIVSCAADLFNQHGYAGTSMTDLMAITGLQKGGIYNHFPSKDELAFASFDFAIDRMKRRYRQAIRDHDTAIDRILAILQVFQLLVDQPPIKGGCPLLNTAVDVDDTHPALRQKAKQAMEDWLKLFSRLLEKGKARGEFHLGLDPNDVSSVIIATLEGALMMSRLCDDPVHLDRAIKHLSSFLRQSLAE